MLTTDSRKNTITESITEITNYILCILDKFNPDNYIGLLLAVNCVQTKINFKSSQSTHKYCVVPL